MVDTGVYDDNKLSPASANMVLFLPKHRAWITDSAKERRRTEVKLSKAGSSQD